jgi:hypothetical protein
LWFCCNLKFDFVIEIGKLHIEGCQESKSFVRGKTLDAAAAEKGDATGGDD